MISGAGVAAIGIGVLVAAGLVYGNWFAQSHFARNIALAERIIKLNPDYPGVYESAAWAYYREGQYARAIDVARGDLASHADTMACEVYQVIGMSQLRLGKPDEAIATLRRAVDANPEYGKTYSRLAKALAETGSIEEAIVNYERAAEIMPQYNPGRLNLADAYRKVGRVDDAVEAYEQVIEINPYDVTAQLALAEIAIERKRFGAAADRLKQLLDWMPENTIARTNLGVAYEGLGRPDDAVDAYIAALERNPYSVVALLNLTDVWIRAGKLDDAHRVFIRFLQRLLFDPRVVTAYHDFSLRIGEPLWSAEAFHETWKAQTPPKNDRLRRYAAYAFAQQGRYQQAGELLRLAPAVEDGNDALSNLTRVLVALGSGRVDAALASAERVVRNAHPQPADAVDRLMADMQRMASADGANPWVYYVTAMALNAKRQAEFARLALDECVKRCGDDACRERADSLRAVIRDGN